MGRTMRIKKLVLRILAILGIGVPLVFAGLVAYAIFSIPRGTHSLRKYVESRAKYDQELVGHFPAEIPSSASLKRFTYLPGYMQGGSYIQLRLRLPADKILELYSKFAAIRTKSFFAGDYNSHGYEKGWMPTTQFYTGDGNNRTFPDDFEIMVFDEVRNELPPDQWNHGRSHGVAISTNRNEIVYWADRW